MSSHLHYEKEIFNGVITGGDPAVTSAVFEPPEGLLPEKIGLWISLTLADPGNVLTIQALWAGDDGVYLPTFLASSQTVTVDCILSVCNPGGAKSLELMISSSGTGDNNLVVNAKTNVES
jgi:hypothetical protein